MISRSKHSTSRTRGCIPARLRELGVIPDTMDRMRFCIWFSLVRAWLETQQKRRELLGSDGLTSRGKTSKTPTLNLRPDPRLVMQL